MYDEIHEVGSESLQIWMAAYQDTYAPKLTWEGAAT